MKINYYHRIQLEVNEIEAQSLSSQNIVFVEEIDDYFTKSSIEFRLEAIENEIVKHTVLLNKILYRSIRDWRILIKTLKRKTIFQENF